MRVLIRAPPFEQVVKNEIEELTGKKAKYGSCYEFNTESFEDLARYAYLSRCASRVLVESDDLSLKGLSTFKIHGPLDVQKKYAEHIKDKYDMQLDLDEPDVFFEIVDGKVAVDIVGFDLSKRDYKIYNTPYSLKGNVAFCLLSLCGFGKGKVLLDPSIKTGEFVIEAASYSSGKSIHQFRKEDFLLFRIKNFKDTTLHAKGFDANIIASTYNHKYISYTRKNALVNQTSKLIEFTKNDIDWLDIRLDKADIMITYFGKDDMNIKDKFFDMADKVLSPESKICIVSKYDLYDNRFTKKKLPLDTDTYAFFFTKVI